METPVLAITDTKFGVSCLWYGSKRIDIMDRFGRILADIQLSQLPSPQQAAAIMRDRLIAGQDISTGF